jgi:predicted permease
MPPIAYPTLQEWRTRVSAFSHIAAHAQGRLNLRASPDGAGEPVWVELVSANFFDALGVAAAHGRVFGAADEGAGAGVVVVSHALWRRRFGAEADLVGRTLLFNGVPLTVIGIAPPRFTGVVMGLAFEAWVPVWQQPMLIPGRDWLRDWQARRMQAVARLSPGVTLAQARDELNRAALAVSQSRGESPLTGAGARWISDTQLGSLMGPLSVAMLAVTAVVLLSACANVAGLMLARAFSRERQTAIQVAIGASPWALVRQSLVQAAVLALIGGGVGLWMAMLAKGSLTALAPRVSLPVSIEIDLNWRVALFAAVAVACAAGLFAILPAVRASRPDVVDALKGSPGTRGVRRSRVRQALVVAQMAFSLVSLIMAGFFVRSVQHASRAPLGFGDPRRVLLASTDLSFTRVRDEALAALVDRALERVRSLPGVARASLASFVPLGFGGPPGISTTVDGYLPGPNEPMFVDRAVVGDAYFDTMRIPVIEGRPLTSRDRAGSARVVVVNEAFVARFWPGQSAPGRRIDQGDGWATVVGVAANSAVADIAAPPAPLVYHAWAQAPVSVLTLHVRTDVAPLTLVEPLRHELAAIHPELPVLDAGTLADHMQAATFVQSVGAAIFSVFGAIALVIASVGLYGVVAQHVAERRRELAVVVALGATASVVAGSILRPAFRLAALGLLVGVALAIAASFLVRSQLIGVTAFDLPSIGGSVMTLLAVVTVCCALPTWRAVCVNPAQVLRRP